MNHSPRNSRANEVDLDLSGNHAPATTTLFGNTAVQLDVDLNTPGKQHGHLKLPVIGETGAPHQLRIPVCIIKGSNEGPTATLIAGIHGDEYEGSIVIRRLAHTLSAKDIHGCLILLPSINPAGQAAGLRYNPTDGKNIDYAFPGTEAGTTSEWLAHQITRHFIEPSDIVLDLRSGGRYLKFIPSVAVRFKDTKIKDTKIEEAMFAFGAPNSLRLPASAPHSCLQAMVSAMNKDYLQAELGGGTTYDVQTLSIAHTGCLNILRHLAILKDELTLSSTRILEVRDDTYYVYSPGNGVFEPLSYLGEPVWQDEPLANLVSLESTNEQWVPIQTPRNATLIASHPGGVVRTGDLVAILAEEVQA